MLLAIEILEKVETYPESYQRFFNLFTESSYYREDLKLKSCDTIGLILRDYVYFIEEEGDLVSFFILNMELEMIIEIYNYVFRDAYSFCHEYMFYLKNYRYSFLVLLFYSIFKKSELESLYSEYFVIFFMEFLAGLFILCCELENKVLLEMRNSR